jgi:hypothetical protein
MHQAETATKKALAWKVLFEEGLDREELKY